MLRLLISSGLFYLGKTQNPPCDAPPGLECRLIMKSVTEMVPVNITIPGEQCKAEKCQKVDIVRTNLEERRERKLVNVIVTKGTPECEAGEKTECRLVLKPFTEKVYRYITVPVKKCEKNKCHRFTETRRKIEERT